MLQSKDKYVKLEKGNMFCHVSCVSHAKVQVALPHIVAKAGAVSIGRSWPSCQCCDRSAVTVCFVLTYYSIGFVFYILALFYEWNNIC